MGVFGSIVDLGFLALLRGACVAVVSPLLFVLITCLLVPARTPVLFELASATFRVFAALSPGRALEVERFPMVTWSVGF